MAHDLATQGIMAFQAGDHVRARELLIQAVQERPDDQVRLLWLATVLENPAEQKSCLERVIALGPHSDAGQHAAQQLARFGGAPATPHQGIKSDTVVIIAAVGAVVLVVVLIIASMLMLVLSGGQVSTVFTEIGSGLE
jgi:hypothetical protein